jgi:hypothetical protein
MMFAEMSYGISTNLKERRGSRFPIIINELLFLLADLRTHLPLTSALDMALRRIDTIVNEHIRCSAIQMRAL